jgi:hypothetical protein
MTEPSEERPTPLRTVDDQARTVRRVVAVAVVVAVVWWLAFGRDDGDDSSTADVADVPARREVTYHVTGSANAVDVTMETPSGTSQQQGLEVPLTTNLTGERGITISFRPGAFVYISAQNTLGAPARSPARSRSTGRRSPRSRRAGHTPSPLATAQRSKGAFPVSPFPLGREGQGENLVGHTGARKRRPEQR